jgi:putative NADPH-quinone reductase
MPPALLKGWIDRVFVPDVAYRDAPIGEPMQRIWETGVFGFCGVRTVVRRMYGPVTSSTYEQRAFWLDEVAALVTAEATR